MSMKTVSLLVWQWVRRASFVLNALLAASCQLAHRTGFDLSEPAAAVRTLALGDEELMWLRKGAGPKYLEVREGVVWLTGSSVRGDVLLRHGERLVLRDDGPLLVQAVGSARIVVWS